MKVRDWFSRHHLDASWEYANESDSFCEEFTEDEFLCLSNCGKQRFAPCELCDISEEEGGKLEEVDVMIQCAKAGWY